MKKWASNHKLIHISGNYYKDWKVLRDYGNSYNNQKPHSNKSKSNLLGQELYTIVLKDLYIILKKEEGKEKLTYATAVADSSVRKYKVYGILISSISKEKEIYNESGGT